MPVEHSNQIAPLWWLLQSIVPSITGYVSLFALRFMPVLFGLVTVFFTWCVVRRSWGRRAAFVMVAFVALSDIMIFHNARGEFWESLLLPLLIGSVCLHTDTRNEKPANTFAAIARNQSRNGKLGDHHGADCKDGLAQRRAREQSPQDAAQHGMLS